MSIGAEALSSLPIAGIGSDVYVVDVTVRPDGWKATAFGQAKIALTQKGWVVSTFPPPLAIHNTINIPTGWPAASFGTPTTIATVTFLATSLGKISVFGTPAQSNQVTCVASGANRTTFGKPLSSKVFRAVASGASMPSFGLANSIFRSKPDGWKAPSFGTAQVSRAQMAHGFVATRMGRPQMNRTTPVNPILLLPMLHILTRKAEVYIRS